MEAVRFAYLYTYANNIYANYLSRCILHIRQYLFCPSIYTVTRMECMYCGKLNAPA